MLNKKIFFLLFIFSLFYNQYTLAQLPYSKTVTYKKKDEGTVIAKMVDDLGFKYYLVTDSLMNKELNSNFHSNKLPRLLLKGAYQISENILNSISDNANQSELKKGNISFDEIRKNTLLNLKEASNKLINNNEALLFLNWNDFVNSIAYADAYCDQIILFRKDIGNPYKLKDKFSKTKQNESKVFDESLGADGLTNKQWMNIMEGGGGQEAHDIIRFTNKQNQNILVKLKNEERASIEVGNLEIIKTTSKSIDGLTYAYSSFPPKQLSFLYSNDSELVKGLVDWIIYINSGNSVKLSEMFRVGLDDKIFIDANINQSLVNHKYRDITDTNKNKVRLEFSKKHFDKIKFSDIIIKKVIIKNSLIRFFDETNSFSGLAQNSKQIIVILKNIGGDLLNRIKVNINQTREGLNEYDNTIMNLSKY